MKILLSSVILAIAFSSASAIRCYVCNTHNETECADIKPGAKSKFLIDCSDLKNGYKYTLCRKLDMYMDMDFGENHPAENRIHRSCGYIEDEEKRDCYYKSGYNTRTWVCSCNTDDCNSSLALGPFALGVLFSSLLTVISFLSNSFRI